jgi:hypothetical protein
MHYIGTLRRLSKIDSPIFLGGSWLRSLGKASFSGKSGLVRVKHAAPEALSRPHGVS